MVDQALEVGVGLRRLGNGSHRFQRFHRVFAGGRLARKHDRAGAVVDGVGHVGDLGTGGAGVVHHGIQHLRGGDADLARAHRAVDQMLLDGGDLGVVDLDAHIAAGDHDAVGHGQDLVDVVDALTVLDLGDDAHRAVVFVQQVADLHDVLRVARKAGRDQVKALLDAKQDVVAVALAHVRHRKMHAGHVDALLGLDDAVVLHGAQDVGVGDLVDVQFDQTVVQHDAAARLHVMGQVFVGDRADLVGAVHLAGGQRELLAGGQGLGAVDKGAQADLGAFGVQHGRHGQVHLGAQGAQGVQAALMFRMVPVGEVEPRNIHAVLQQLGQDTGLVGRGAQRTNDLCLTHTHMPP